MTTTINLPQSVIKRLEKVAASSRRTPEALAKQAINDRLDYEEWALAQIDAGLEEIKAGKGIPHDEFWKSLNLTDASKKAA